MGGKEKVKGIEKEMKGGKRKEWKSVGETWKGKINRRKCRYEE